ncbi:hypothetical protein DFH09DRAFT_1089829 [Mycena vulgaris]|nr:hypothetical protein DFH09DRAFT_1089829 [Mycena vulgaris]
MPPTLRSGGIEHCGCGWRRKEILKTNREPEGNMSLGMLKDACPAPSAACSHLNISLGPPVALSCGAQLFCLSICGRGREILVYSSTIKHTSRQLPAASPLAKNLMPNYTGQ